MKKYFYHNDIIKICDWNHFTADEIYHKLKDIHPKVWVSTVYRNIEELTKLWKLNKITNVWQKALFEKNKWFHMHIFDKSSQKLIDVDIDSLNIPLPDNFKVDDIELVIKWEFVDK